MFDDDVIINQDDMVLDMDNFDFSMIDAPVEEVVEEIEEEEVEVEEEVESEEEEAEEVEEVEEEVEEDSGEEEVDFENYEIDLPSGETVVLSELVAGFKTAAEITAEKAELEAVKADFESKTAGMERFLSLAKLEAERVIEDYEDFDWVTLAKEDPQAYVENREFLDKYKARHKEITGAVADLEAKAEAETNRITAEKAREANAILARDIPGWGEKMYKTLIEFAVEKGANQDTLLNSTDPFLFKLLHKTLEHEKGVQKVTAKVKKLGSPKKVVKAAPAKPAVSKDAKREAMIKKATEAGDMSAMFHLLVD